MKSSQSARISSSKDLGVILARARKERGLSQREVAAQLGVTQKWISAIEQGKSRAWIDKVLELSYFLGVQIHANTADAAPSTPSQPDAPSIDDLLSNES
ncbi:helix-turn-helix domain-containing protein [Pelagicoccus enzymogenes]|uniref:helix-turn-helix domain-containing protein n=1 Tax=Pelagicoccus enzymogenes TaxID=2773457 RepID=UPI00280CD434|nr:helix-turn-helix domain-containing protein [Pelagicoccus enzymogenes]MDQ8200303.1 helix-turn-helix domain-containing protein [Pelagicoccus enzymogenes]